MQFIALRARCPQCNAERDLFGPMPTGTPAQLDLFEAEIGRRGPLLARCSACDAVEQIALFVDGVQAEPWQDADEAERQHGRSAGPLSRKPWPDTN